MSGDPGYIAFDPAMPGDGQPKTINRRHSGGRYRPAEKICRPIEGEDPFHKGIVDLDVTLEHDIPEYRLTVDRERAVDTGLMTANIVRSVGALVGGKAVSTYEDEDGDAVNLRVRLPQDLRQDPEQVKQLRLSVQKFGQPPALVPLGELVSFKGAPPRRRSPGRTSAGKWPSRPTWTICLLVRP